MTICLHTFIIYRIRDASAATVGGETHSVHATVDTLRFNMESIQNLLNGRQLLDYVRLTEEEFPVILEKLQVKFISNSTLFNPFNFHV